MTNIGVIGYGYWGPNLVRNFSEIKDSRVEVVCDQRPEQLDRARGRYPSIRAVPDAESVFSDPGIDAVAIATPVASHYELTMRALAAGKHVLVEKPLASNSKQAGEMVEEARKRGKTLMVDHTFIYTGAVQKIHELVQSGELGDLFYYDSVRVNLGLFQEDVDVIWDLAVHDLSIMAYVLPFEPKRVHAVGIRHVEGQHTNMAYLTLGFDEPMLAHIHVNWLAPTKIRRTLIGGSQKMIVYDDLNADEKVRVYDKGITLSDNTTEDAKSVYKMLAYRRTGDMLAPKLRPNEALEVEARHFIDCVNGKASPLTDGESALQLVRILEAATRSMNEGGIWIDLED